jgi:hypothetical protein
LKLFGRDSKTGKKTPPEIEEYYQAERRERVGIAWGLALATLVATVLLALGIFYGGRWAYRVLIDREAAPPAAPAQPAPAPPGPAEDQLVPPPAAENGQPTPPAAPAPRAGPVLPEVGSPDNL